MVFWISSATLALAQSSTLAKCAWMGAFTLPNFGRDVRQAVERHAAGDPLEAERGGEGERAAHAEAGDPDLAIAARVTAQEGDGVGDLGDGGRPVELAHEPPACASSLATLPWYRSGHSAR